MDLSEAVIQHLIVIKDTFDQAFLSRIAAEGEKISERVKKGGTIFLMGNGGSAADSQHISAEFISKLSRDRRALPALALTVDTSALTAISNDYGYETVFSRQLEALCKESDIVIGISTSGLSENVISGLNMGKSLGAYTIGFSGNDGFNNVSLDAEFLVKHKDTARIQEAHILLGHLLCMVVERDFV